MKLLARSTLFSLLALSPACDVETSAPPERGVWSDVGKADGTASCAGFCDAQAPAGCWCDDTCASFGDCCPDYAPVCEGDPGSTHAEAILLSDEYVTHQYWRSFEPLYRGHEAWVPLAVNVHPGSNVVATVEVRKYRWSETLGMVDEATQMLPQRPEAIGLTSDGALMSVGLNDNLLRVQGRDDELSITPLNGSGTRSANGNVFADAAEGRYFVPVFFNSVHRTQIVDARAFGGWQEADVFNGTVKGVLGQTAVAHSPTAVTLWDVSDPYEAVPIRSVAAVAPQSDALIDRGVVYVAAPAGELTVLDGRTGETLAQRDIIDGPFGRSVHRQGSLLMVAADKTVEVFDVTDPRDPVQVDAIELGPETAIDSIHALNGAGDVLHIWATDDQWGLTDEVGNARVRVRTLRLPNYQL